MINKQVFQQLALYPRTVIIFSHTSYADFFILSLYLLANPSELVRVKILIKPQVFQYFGFLLKRLGSIPATRLEDKNGGAVDRIIKEVGDDPCLFLISPKGTIVRAPWRSGYYHIAQGLQAQIRVAGLDYEKKKVILFENLSSKLSQEDLEIILKNQLKHIVPLFPEDEVVEIRKHNEKERSIISLARLFGSSLILSGIGLCFGKEISLLVLLIILITEDGMIQDGEWE
jgi:hypothetical protein